MVGSTKRPLALTSSCSLFLVLEFRLGAQDDQLAQVDPSGGLTHAPQRVLNGAYFGDGVARTGGRHHDVALGTAPMRRIGGPAPAPD